MTSELEEFIRSQISRRFLKVGRLAKAIGLTHSSFTRGVRDHGTLGLESLLRLAQVTNTPASDVLRIGKKAELAALIEQLYGPATAEPLRPDVLECARLLSSYDAEAIGDFRRFLLSARAVDRE